MTHALQSGGESRVDRAARDRVLDCLSAIDDTGHPPPGYVIGSTETDDHADHSFVFCYEHARMVAHGDSILTGCEMHITNVSQGETDCQEWCAFHGCKEAVNTGSPTDYWIDSVLGLTEEDPYTCRVTPYELARSAWNMTDTDKRWPVWFKQAERTIARSKRGHS